MRRLFLRVHDPTGTCFTQFGVKTVLTQSIQQALADGRVIFNDKNFMSRH
jgi:hypothetical protein